MIAVLKRHTEKGKSENASKDKKVQKSNCTRVTIEYVGVVDLTIGPNWKLKLLVELWIESVKNTWEVLNHKTNVGSLEWNQNFETSLRVKAMWIGPTLTKLFQDTHKKDRQETNCSFWPFLFYAKRNKHNKEKENWDWIDGNLMTKMRSK